MEPVHGKEPIYTASINLPPNSLDMRTSTAARKALSNTQIQGPPVSFDYKEIIKMYVDSASRDKKKDYEAIARIFLNFLEDSAQNTIDIMFSSCQVTSFPDIWHLPAFKTRLERIYLEGFAQIHHLPESIGNCNALISISIKKCAKLATLPKSVGQWQELETFQLSHCPELTSLPDSIGNWQKLTTAQLTHCPKLNALPDSIGNWQKLEILNLEKCTSLREISLAITPLPNDCSVDLTGCNLPADVIEHLKNISENSQGPIVTLPIVYEQDEVLSNGSTTEVKDSYKEIVQKWVDGASAGNKKAYEKAQIEILIFFQNEQKDRMIFSNLNIASLPDIWHLPACQTRLKYLEISRCAALETLTESMRNLTALRRLDLNYCNSLIELPNLNPDCTVKVEHCPFLQKVIPPNIEINSFDHITRYLPNRKGLLEQAKTRTITINALCEDLKAGNWANILKKETLETLPLDALGAFERGSIIGEQFTTLMIYWAAFSQLPAKDIIVQPLFDPNGEVNPNVKKWIKSTIGLELGEESTLDTKLRIFFKKMKERPISEQSFLYISTDNYSKTKEKLDQKRADEESKATKTSKEELLPKYERTISEAIAKGAKFNVLHHFSHLDASYRMIASFSMMQRLLEAQRNKTTITITPVIGLSSVEDIRKNGLERTREMALPFPGIELPKTADLLSAPLDIDFVFHDFYHSMVVNAIPDEWRKKFIEVADTVKTLELKEKNPDIKKFLGEFFERMIDLEHPYFRSINVNPTMSENEKFSWSIVLQELVALTREHPLNIYQARTVKGYQSNWEKTIRKKHEKIKGIMNTLFQQFISRAFLTKVNFDELSKKHFESIYRNNGLPIFLS